MVLHEVGELAAILTVACTGFNFIVIKPLRGAIDSLQKSIERLANAVDDIRDKHNTISAHQAHHRLSGARLGTME